MQKWLTQLKKPQVVSFFAVIIVQIAVRFGYNFDSAEVESTVLSVLDGVTAVTALIVAHKSDKNSLL